MTALAAIAVVALSCLFAAGAPSGDRWRAMKPTVVVERDRRPCGFVWDRWYWRVQWPVSPTRCTECGYTLTKLGARVAAWRAAR